MSPLIASVLLAAAGLAAAGTGTKAEPAPDAAALIAQARRVQVEDLDAWRRFAFRRQVLHRRLDDQGKAIFRQQLGVRAPAACAGGRVADTAGPRAELTTA